MHDVQDAFMTKVRKMAGNGTGLLLGGGSLDEVEVEVEVEAFLQKNERAVVEGVSIEHIIISRSVGVGTEQQR